MSTPGILTVEDCFAAAENAEAIRKVRAYCVEVEQSVTRCRQRFASGYLCPSCIARDGVISDIRGLLPAVEAGDMDDDRDRDRDL